MSIPSNVSPKGYIHNIRVVMSILTFRHREVHRGTCGTCGQGARTAPAQVSPSKASSIRCDTLSPARRDKLRSCNSLCRMPCFGCETWAGGPEKMMARSSDGKHSFTGGAERERGYAEGKQGQPLRFLRRPASCPQAPSISRPRLFRTVAITPWA